MPKEVRFTYQHDGCWLQETTARHPEIVMVASSMYLVGEDVFTNLAVHGPPGAIRAVQEEWSHDPRLHKVSVLSTAKGTAVFHIGYRSDRSIVRHVLEHAPVSVGATRHAQGKEYHHVIGEAGDLDGLLKALAERGTVQVTSLREADESEPPSSPLARLTDQESESLLAAYLGGYFQWPRRTSADDLAKGIGVSHTAFLNRLRQAETKVMEDLMAEVARREPGRLEAARSRASRRAKLQAP